jgi:hypothetical protein
MNMSEDDDAMKWATETAKTLDRSTTKWKTSEEFKAMLREYRDRKKAAPTEKDEA